MILITFFEPREIAFLKTLCTAKSQTDFLSLEGLSVRNRICLLPRDAKALA